jgi:hypothetical protein
LEREKNFLIVQSYLLHQASNIRGNKFGQKGRDVVIGGGGGNTTVLSA